jgi:hypothetical protein
MTRKICKGRYAIDVTCKCGGQIFVDRVSHGEFKWEAFCCKCWTCDPNGWPTLREAESKAGRYFGKLKARVRR